MSIFVQALPPDIPQRLCHYTRAGNLKNMLKGDTKSVCFWLKNNRDKNDKAELQMGIDLMTKAREYLKSKNQFTLLDRLSNFENSYSLSFTEGKVNSHMLTEYGSACLEFDLRYLDGDKPKKCEYCTEEDIDELAEECIADFNQCQDLSSFESLKKWIVTEWDIIQKIATIKRKTEWEQEGEWRIIMHKQQNDSRYISAPDGTQRLILNIPIKALTRITLFYDGENKPEMNKTHAYLKVWKRQNDVRTFDVVMRDAKRIDNVNNNQSC